MGLYPDIPIEKLSLTLNRVVEQVSPCNLLIICEPKSFCHWQIILTKLEVGSHFISTRVEPRSCVPEEGLMTLNDIEDFNRKAFSPLRLLSETERQTLYQELLEEHRSRPSVDLTTEELKAYDFIILDDSLLTSKYLTSNIHHPSTLLLTGIKTPKNYSGYSNLLMEETAELLYEDHSTPQGLAAFQRKDTELLQEILLDDFRNIEPGASDAQTPLHHIIGLTPPSQEERPSTVIILPPDLHRAAGHYEKVHHLTFTNSHSDIFIVAPDNCRDLYSRLPGAPTIFTYDPKTLYQNKTQMRGFVKGLSLLSIEKLFVLTDEEDILSALLVYHLTKQDTVIVQQKELSAPPPGDNLFPLKSWESDWAKAFFSELQLTPSQTIVISSGGKYPTSRIVRSLKKFTDCGAYRLIHVGESEELFDDEVIRSPEGITFGQIAGIISQSKLVVGCESPLMYLAQLLGTPQTTVIGGGALQSFPFRANRTTFACLPFGCSTCPENCRHDASIGCLDDLPEEIITIAVKHALTGYHDTASVFFPTSNRQGGASAEEAHLTLLQQSEFTLVPIQSHLGERFHLSKTQLLRSDANFS